MDPKDYEFFLEHINGLMVIDKEGRTIYMNQQCADYINKDIKTSIGKPVEEVFPPSKMRRCLNEASSPVMQFYFVDGRASASLDVPLKKDGEIIGVLEYDFFQDLGVLDDFIVKYKNVMDDELRYYRDEIKNYQRTKYSIDNLVGESPKVKMLKKQIGYASNSHSTVLITGETGTGKELVAHSIHNASKRKFQNFIRINSAAIPENLAESELFGYEEGSFTGAKKGGKKGKFELADKGTLFIDEIDKMPLNLQAKFLRVLQEKEIELIGGEASIPVDVRVIAATSSDLKKMVEDGTFREDLYYRLNVLEIKIIPLRERKDDILHITNMYIQQMNNALGRRIVGIDPLAMEQMYRYDWPGNIRELNNVIERAMNYADDTQEILTLEDIQLDMNTNRRQAKDGQLSEIRLQAEKSAILEALKRAGGNKTHASKALGISRQILYKKMRKYQIDK